MLHSSSLPGLLIRYRNGKPFGTQHARASGVVGEWGVDRGTVGPWEWGVLISEKVEAELTRDLNQLLSKIGWVLTIRLVSAPRRVIIESLSRTSYESPSFDFRLYQLCSFMRALQATVKGGFFFE